MLTRLEVDGFKNLVNFAVDLGPLTCVAGANGIGKSNLFDAIRFLSLLADKPLVEAARLIRSDDEQTGDPKGLFWTDGSRRASTMRFGVEMIVPEEVTDDFGRKAKASITFLRYELEIGWEPPTGLARLGGLRLIREDLRHILLGDAGQHLRFPHRVKEFRNQVVKGRRAGPGFISTETKTESRDGIEQEIKEIHIRQDGGSRGPPRAVASSAPRTVIGTTTTSSDPTILAARREFQSWRFLALEPSAMRRADRFIDPTSVASNGAFLASTLYRLATRAEAGQEPQPEDFYARVALRLSGLVGVRAVRVDRDNAYERLTLQVEEPGGAFLPARALSEGTLRFLALTLLAVDPDSNGLICMEEPENGIHPGRMRAMVDLARELAVDPSRAPGVDNPFRQVILNTHSPRFVEEAHALGVDLLAARTVVVRSPTTGGLPTRSMRLSPLQGNWRCSDENPGIHLTHLGNYLTLSSGGQGQVVASEGR